MKSGESPDQKFLWHFTWSASLTAETSLRICEPQLPHRGDLGGQHGLNCWHVPMATFWWTLSNFHTLQKHMWKFPEIGVWDFPWNQPSILGIPHLWKPPCWPPCRLRSFWDATPNLSFLGPWRCGRPVRQVALRLRRASEGEVDATNGAWNGNTWSAGRQVVLLLMARMIFRMMSRYDWMFVGLEILDDVGWSWDLVGNSV